MSFLKKIALAGVLACTAGSASAATLSQTFSTGVQSVPVNSTQYFSTFDTGLGTLNSVELSVNGVARTTYILQNNEGQTHLFDLYLDGDAQFGVNGSYFPSITLSDADIKSVGAGGQVPGNLSDQFSESYIFTGLQLADFLGDGVSTVGINYFVNAIISVNSLLDYRLVANPTASISLEAIYDYTPTSAIPVPAAMPLLIGALGGLVAFGRKRKSDTSKAA